jgi:thiamine-phosphate pyrophosphorylase
VTVPRVPLEFGLYGILTDPLVGYERMTELLVSRGVRFIQLRMKHAPRVEVVKVGRRLRPLIGGASWLIVNDDPEAAAEVGADGVHLGQGDMPYAQARALLGPGAIIGLSTHNPAQTRAACALGPDYIGVGPVFPTPTKDLPDPVLGLEGMRELLGLADRPAVVLGGIDATNLGAVLAAGARNACAVRALNRAADPAAELDRLLAILAATGGPRSRGA